MNPGPSLGQHQCVSCFEATKCSSDALLCCCAFLRCRLLPSTSVSTASEIPWLMGRTASGAAGRCLAFWSRCKHNALIQSLLSSASCSLFRAIVSLLALSCAMSEASKHPCVLFPTCVSCRKLSDASPERQDQAATCDSYTCPAQTVPKDDASDIVGNSVSACCDQVGPLRILISRA